MSENRVRIGLILIESPEDCYITPIYGHRQLDKIQLFFGDILAAWMRVPPEDRPSTTWAFFDDAIDDIVWPTHGANVPIFDSLLDDFTLFGRPIVTTGSVGWEGYALRKNT